MVGCYRNRCLTNSLTHHICIANICQFWLTATKASKKYIKKRVNSRQNSYWSKWAQIGQNFMFSIRLKVHHRRFYGFDKYQLCHSQTAEYRATQVV